MLSHRSVHDRFVQELRQRQMDGRLSRPVRFHEVQAWPYLQAVVYEAMRLYTPAAFVLDRDVLIVTERELRQQQR